MTESYNYSLPVWVAGGYELNVLGNWSAIDSPITHDFLDESNTLSGVGFVKEHHSG